MRGRKPQLGERKLHRLVELLRLRARLYRRLTNKALARRFKCSLGAIESAAKRARRTP